MLATIAGSQLTADLKPQLTLLVDDMCTRLDDGPGRTATWRDAHRQAVKDKRTAAARTDYVDDQRTQAAVGWLLTPEFARFCGSGHSRARVDKALESIRGVDVNALRESGDVPRYTLNLATGDSLLHGPERDAVADGVESVRVLTEDVTYRVSGAEP